MTLSRRLFCRGAVVAGAATAVPLLSSPEVSRSIVPIEPSGLVTGKPRALPYEVLDGFLSGEQLRWHHESHYGGALKGFVKFDSEPTGNHRGRIGKANSVLLHEHYFENMTSKQASAGEGVATALKARFGSVERWIDDFRAAAKSARGWAVLAFHPVNGKLYNVATDSHDDGPPWLGVPLVVVDSYEHSYYIDFQNKKADYVAGFTDHIDWAVVEQRYRDCAS